jgi:RsiW-degrading membrane proteinase PrsW (M82 family)
MRSITIASGLLIAFLLHGFFNLLAVDAVVISIVLLLVAYVPILWLFTNRNIETAVRACTIAIRRK